MAVNILKLNGWSVINFLSRLYGGEHVNLIEKVAKYFLSRLYGGELESLDVQHCIDFLSRLYGGEHGGVMG